MSIIYIAGPMTGIEDFNRAVFEEADDRLSAQGHSVFNPARIAPKMHIDSVPYSGYLKIALAMLDCCDAIYMLDGWTNSRGAIIEHAYAVATNKHIMGDA